MVTQREHGNGADRVAIVTGGSRGVGREISRALASRGYALVLGYFRNVTAAEAAVEEILAAHGIAIAVRADVADELDVERLFSETTEAFAGVDVVVDAAGPGTRMRDTVVDRQACRQLRAGGALVRVSSAADTRGTVAVEHRTRELARELDGRDVTVNAVLCPWDDPGASAAVVDAVAFLVGAHARGVTGRLIRIDGPGRSPVMASGATGRPRRDDATDRPAGPRQTKETQLMDVAALADLLHETAEHHDPFEKAAPKHDWWDWYAAYMHAREHGRTPDEASEAARRYMEEVRGVVIPR